MAKLVNPVLGVFAQKKTHAVMVLCAYVVLGATPAVAMDCNKYEDLISNLVSYSNKASTLVESCSKDIKSQKKNSSSCSRLHGDDHTMVQFASYKQQFDQIVGSSLSAGFRNGVEMGKCVRVDPAPLVSAMNRYNLATQELMQLANKK
jgi:hypothetical protein